MHISHIWRELERAKRERKREREKKKRRKKKEKNKKNKFVTRVFHMTTKCFLFGKAVLNWISLSRKKEGLAFYFMLFLILYCLRKESSG